MKHALMAAAAAVATAGCGASNADVIGKVRPRVAFDLGCPEAQVSVVRLEGEPDQLASYGATGCGRRARYETSCDQNRGPDSCQVRTQSVEAGSAAGPAP